MTTITVINGQTLSDIAIQYYGCIEGIIQLIQDNPNIGAFEQILKPGTKLQIQDNVPVFNTQNVKMAAFFSTNSLEVSTGTPSGIPGGAAVILADDGNPILADDGQPILITPSVNPILTDDGHSIDIH
jgi:phage tail protein X